MTRSGQTARYRQLLKRFHRVKLAVAGDLIADEFIYGQIDRVSREAPVLILRYDSTEIVPGGGGNAACNGIALGARVDVVGLVGKDEAGRRLLAAMPPGARLGGVVRSGRRVTPVKTRILAGGVHSAKQQVVRIDRPGSPITQAQARRVEAALTRIVRGVDAVILSDYGSGLVTPPTWQRVVAATGKKTPPIVLVDSRYALAGFAGMTACTPNEAEVESLLGVRIGDDGATLERAGRELLRRLRCRAVLVTRGSRGMALFEPGKPTDHVPIVGSDQVTDVTGAGDTVIAAFTLALAAGASFGEAARIANYAGGIVVMKRGTAVVTVAEIEESIEKTSGVFLRNT
jgi:D-glycero-beta-D-manno-heptose-7-phosphate kinase